MKFWSVFPLSVLAVDTEPPVITLDLAASSSLDAFDNSTFEHNGTKIGVGCLCDYTLASTCNNGVPDSTKCNVSENARDASSTDVEKYARVCTAKAFPDPDTCGDDLTRCQTFIPTDEFNCPIPNAEAWDHHDGILNEHVQSYLLLVREGLHSGRTCATNECKGAYTSSSGDHFTTEQGHLWNNKTASGQSLTKYQKCEKPGDSISPQNVGCKEMYNAEMRSEWIIKYVVEDFTGNRAEPLLFTMIFNDIYAPAITSNIRLHDNTTWDIECGNSTSNTKGGKGNGRFFRLTRNVNDTEAPTKNWGTDPNDNDLPNGDYAPVEYGVKDNYDGEMADQDGRIEMTLQECNSLGGECSCLNITNPSGDTLPCGQNNFLQWGVKSSSAYKYDIDTREKLFKIFKIDIKATDTAELFGYNGQDNVLEIPGTRFRVVDTTPPNITITTDVTKYCKPGNTTYWDGNSPLSSDSLSELDCTIECNKTNDAGVGLNASDWSEYNGFRVTPGDHWVRPKVVCADVCDSNTQADIYEDPAIEQLYFLQNNSGLEPSPHAGSIANVKANTDINQTQTELVDQYDVTWYCQDRAGNENDAVHTIHVIDTTPPELTIGCGNSPNLMNRYVDEDNPGNSWRHDGTAGDCVDEDSAQELYHSAGYIKDLQIVYDALKQNTDTHTAGWECTDTCDGSDLLTQWDHSNHSTTNLYQDTNDNIAQWASRPSRCEERDNNNETKVSINDFNQSTPHQDFSGTFNHTVGGANDAVFKRQTMGFCNEVPGTYVVKYYCQDKSGNGVSKFQTIYNEDHIIPIIHILGHPHMVLEATVTGNYVDDGAVCTDQIDGMISQNVEVSGDVVNLSKAATYRIFYDCADSAGRIARQRTRTVVVADCTCPTCEVIGDPIKTIEASFPYVDNEFANCTDSLEGPLNSTAETNGWKNWNGSLNVEMTGTYKITYITKDKAGHSNIGNQSSDFSSYCLSTEKCPNINSDDSDYRKHVRTIHVVDTLKPVIALKYDKYFHGDFASDTGVNNLNPEPQDNPAEGHFRAAMAELNKPAVNGWLVGAVVSSVTGLAILAYNRRTTVSTAVPV